MYKFIHNSIINLSIFIHHILSYYRKEFHYVKFKVYVYEDHNIIYCFCGKKWKILK
jgi:hypothetical protein